MPTEKLKHPVCKDVDYIDIKRNRVLLKTYGKEIEGKTWRQFQLLIGKEFGAGRYGYIYKFKDGDMVSRGLIEGVNVSKKEPVETGKPSDPDLLFVKESIKKINEKLDASKGGLGIDAVLQVTRQNYDMQITFLNREIDKKDAQIIKLEIKIEKLEDELLNVDESGGTISIMEYLKIAKEFLPGLRKPGLPITNLQESDQSDIPPEILELLGLVDWNSVQLEVKTMIIDTLGKYIQKLPMKKGK